MSTAKAHAENDEHRQGTGADQTSESDLSDPGFEVAVEAVAP